MMDSAHGREEQLAAIARLRDRFGELRRQERLGGILKYYWRDDRYRFSSVLLCLLDPRSADVPLVSVRLPTKADADSERNEV
jgi:hypothetical protein